MKINKIFLIGVFLIGVFFCVFYFLENKKNNYKNEDLKNESNKKPGYQMEVSSYKDSVLYFGPSEREVFVGENFSVDVMINPGKNNVEAISVHIIFDKDKLHLNSINPSDRFKLILSEPIIDNNDGIASIDVAVPISEPSNSEVSKVVVLNFSALAPIINSEISYTPASQVAAKGESRDVLKRREKFLLTIK